MKLYQLENKPHTYINLDLIKLLCISEDEKECCFTVCAFFNIADAPIVIHSTNPYSDESINELESNLKSLENKLTSVNNGNKILKKTSQLQNLYSKLDIAKSNREISEKKAQEWLKTFVNEYMS